MGKKILAVIGTYRKGCTTDSVVTAILDAAEKRGAEVGRIYLIDKHIEFCTNCRECTQTDGNTRGTCVHEDDMKMVLDEIDDADAFVLAAPVNFGNVTAITRRFMERLLCYAFWPWGKVSPKFRLAGGRRPAVLVTSSSMPAPMLRLFTGALRSLRLTAKLIGAKPVASVAVGLSAVSRKQPLSDKIKHKAGKAGARISV